VSPLGRAAYLPAFVEVLLAAELAGREEPRDPLADVDEARDAAAELTRIADTFGTPLLRALALDASARVAHSRDDAAAAVPVLTEALDAWLALGAPYPAARIRVALADACETLGDAEGARLQRDAARRVFTDLAAAPDLAAIEAAGHGPRTDGILTPRELEVLRAAATGRTNKEIGAELRLSTRTVDRHVSNILTKLGVPSRAAATSYAYEHGLIRR
jgi:DNA-binding NarL/FixJ family response regulator